MPYWVGTPGGTSRSGTHAGSWRSGFPWCGSRLAGGGHPLRNSVMEISQDSQPGQSARTVSQDSQTGQSVRTVSQDSQPGQSVRTVSQDSQPGQSARTVSQDSQSGQSVHCKWQPSSSLCFLPEASYSLVFLKAHHTTPHTQNHDDTKFTSLLQAQH